nr:eukaryotic translation initiation factor 3 subunit E [Tanacetum cinerariifolium]
MVGMSKYDLTPLIAPNLDKHLVFPLLKFTQEQEIYPNEQILKAKIKLLNNNNMVDYAMDIHKSLYHTDDVPQDMIDRRVEVVARLKSLEEAAAPLIGLEQIEALYQYAKFQFECGNYSGAADYLYQYRALCTNAERSLSALWGKLAAEILMQKWYIALEEHNRLKEIIDSKNFTSSLNQVQSRIWLMHWSLFIFFNHDNGKTQIIDLFNQDKYLNAIQTNTPHLLRYLATAFIVNKKRRRQFKEFIKVIQQEQHSFADPITEFLACTSLGSRHETYYELCSIALEVQVDRRRFQLWLFTILNRQQRSILSMIQQVKVIKNGDSLKRTGRGTDGALIFLPPATTEEHLAVQRESKARTTLLQSIPDDHIANFYYMDDARDIWNAIKARFGGNAESKKMRKSMLKQEFLEFRISEAEGVHKGYDRMQKILSQLKRLDAKPDAEEINLRLLRALPSLWFQVALTLKTKGGLEFLSFDDLYYKLKTLEMDIKGYNTFSSSQSAGPSHSAFVSATSTSKKMPYGDSPNYSSSTTYSVPSNSKTGSRRTSNKAGRKIDFDKKESARFNKQKVKCFKCQQRGHFARECREKGEFGMIAGANSEEAIQMMLENLLLWVLLLSDKSSEVKTSDFAFSDSSGKSSEHKPTDFTSCASTSSVSTSVNEVEIESNIGTPIKEPISVQDLPSFTCNSSNKIEHSSRTSCNKNGSFNKKAGHFRKHALSVSKFCFVCGSGTHLIKDCDFYKKQMANTTISIREVPTIRPQPVPTGKPKVTPVPTGKPKVKSVSTALLTITGSLNMDLDLDDLFCCLMDDLGASELTISNFNPADK